MLSARKKTPTQMAESARLKAGQGLAGGNPRSKYRKSRTAHMFVPAKPRESLVKNSLFRSDMKSHLDALNRQFAQSKRPLIFGTNANARALLLYGLLDIPFDKLQGFVDPSNQFVAHLYYFRGLSVDEMKKLSPDFILNVQSIQLPPTLTSDGVGVEYLIPEKFRK